MKNFLKKSTFYIFIIAVLTVALCFSVSAAKEKYLDGNIYYTVTGGEATVVGSTAPSDGVINIPDMAGDYPVTAIGSKAFERNNSFSTVVIPASVTDISASFDFCYNFEKFIVHKDNKYYSSDEYGVLFNKDKTELIRYPMGNKRVSYDIPDTVKTVASKAFYLADDLKNITIPGSVTAFGTGTFSYTGITSAIIPDGFTKVDDYLFEGCHDLITVTIPDTVTAIGKWAFCATGFESFAISDNITSIGDYAFFECSKLKSINIPGSVKSIGTWAFAYTALTEVTFCEGVTSIADQAFGNCYNLKSVTIPNSVSHIGEEAFGWFYQESDWGDAEYKDSDFTITAGRCSAAHKYAKENGFKFIDNNSNEHSFTTSYTKATFEADGKTESKCSACGDVEKTEAIAKIGSLTLSTTKYIYDGKNKTPKLTVKDANGKTLVKNTDYKITVASKRSGIGRYTVKVTFIGNYSGSKNLYFYILPGKPATVKSASQGTTSNKLTWSAVPGAVGYTLYYYSNSKKAYVKINTTTNTTYTVKGLLTGTKYTFKIVAYGETASGKVYDSETYALLKSATKTKTPELTKVTASSTKGKAYVYHTDVKGETGYTVYYSTSSTTGFKKYANFKADTTRCDITKLTSGKTYYFKVRTYIKTDSGYVYSAWSNIKGVKVK